MEHLNRTAEQRTTESFDWTDVVGIREWQNKACYICEIEVQDEFDPMKLSLNVVEYKFIVKDDELVADEAILSSIIYDGTEYEWEDIEATGKGSDLIWGYDPEEEYEWEDEDDEDYEDEDKDGTTEVKLDGEEFRIDANGNRIE